MYKHRLLLQMVVQAIEIEELERLLEGLTIVFPDRLVVSKPPMPNTKAPLEGGWHSFVSVYEVMSSE